MVDLVGCLLVIWCYSGGGRSAIGKRIVLAVRIPVSYLLFLIFFLLFLLTGGGLSDADRCGVLYESMALWFSGSRDASLGSGYNNTVKNALGICAMAYLTLRVVLFPFFPTRAEDTPQGEKKNHTACDGSSSSSFDPRRCKCG